MKRITAPRVGWQAEWALATASSTFLSTTDSNRIYAKIGAGETLSAVRDLLSTLVDNDDALPAGVVQELRGWIAGYVGTGHELELRALLARIRVVYEAPAPREPESRKPLRLTPKRPGPAFRRRSTNPMTHRCGPTSASSGLMAVSMPARRRRRHEARPVNELLQTRLGFRHRAWPAI